jgi:hypothetical protein
MTMSDIFAGETVIPMPPLSIPLVEQLAEGILAELSPKALAEPTEVDLLEWVDTKLAKHGIHVSPVSDDKLPDSEALTIPANAGAEILVRESAWDDLLTGGRKANRVRATIAHEVPHAVVHVPVLRRRKASTYGDLFLRRVARADVVAYRDPEWQAWALAGCIMAPRRTIAMLDVVNAREVANVFGMSEAMARSHLRRLKIADTK